MNAQWQQGDLVDEFRLEEPLPLATTATFWRVSRAHEAGRLLMKVPRLGANPINIVAFEAEQMILAKLSGPHVPRFVAAGSLENPYIVMEMIEGATMRPLIEALPLPFEKVAELGAKIAAALDAIHRQHVIHLDLKPSNVMLRTSGEAVLIDFGFSRHTRLPDILAEEFPGPIGTGPYISPEQLLGVRDDPRSDLFALGVMLYFFVTGERPFGDPVSVRAWRRRLYREPPPPRARRPDCPPWLQEIILRCLEIDPERRYSSAAQAAFDLRNPEQVELTARSERTEGGGMLAAIGRWMSVRPKQIAIQPPTSRQADTSPIVLAAVDLTIGAEELAEELRVAVQRILHLHPGARLACINVLKQSLLAIDKTEDEQGRNLHLRRLAELQYWARPLPVPAYGVTFHVFEAVDPAAAIIDYARNNRVDHIVIGARASSTLRRYLGSVSSQVVAESPCTVTVVRRRQGTSPTETPAAQ